jgi:hypothetical protein
MLALYFLFVKCQTLLKIQFAVVEFDICIIFKPVTTGLVDKYYET